MRDHPSSSRSPLPSGGARISTAASLPDPETRSPVVVVADPPGRTFADAYLDRHAGAVRAGDELHDSTVARVDRDRQRRADYQSLRVARPPLEQRDQGFDRSLADHPRRLPARLARGEYLTAEREHHPRFFRRGVRVADVRERELGEPASEREDPRHYRALVIA